MSKKYQVIPTNRKTLFLRNLERILNNHEVMCECQTKIFRQSTSYEILYLLENYILDSDNNSNELMKDRYQFDSLWSRLDDDNRKLFVHHGHQ